MFHIFHYINCMPFLDYAYVYMPLGGNFFIFSNVMCLKYYRSTVLCVVLREIAKVCACLPMWRLYYLA